MFDPAKKVGGWFPRQSAERGLAECDVLYLPDGRVGFMFGRPKISGNDEMNAGGLRIEVVEPFKRLRVTYAGKACVLAARTRWPSRPRPTAKPDLPCKVELDYEGVSPMFGGETVRDDGKPIEIDPEKSFAKAHYEQHMAAKGTSRSATRSSTSRASACATRAGAPATGRRSTGIAGAR